MSQQLRKNNCKCHIAGNYILTTIPYFKFKKTHSSSDVLGVSNLLTFKVQEPRRLRAKQFYNPFRGKGMANAVNAKVEQTACQRNGTV